MENITNIPTNYTVVARDKIAEELKGFSGGNKEKAVSEFVASTLTEFSEQNVAFAEVVAKTHRTLSDCCKEVMKGCGSHISDIDVYRGAVRFYFPNAEIHMGMTIEINGAAPSEEYMAQESPKPAPKKQPAPQATARPGRAPTKKAEPPKKPEKKEPEILQLSLF